MTDSLLLAITPNPALDRTLVIPGVQLGQVHRAERVLVTAGGKGLNVARAARSLGQPLRICGPLGGLTGQQVAQLAEAEGFVCRWSWNASGETRVCTLLVDPQADDATALNEPGTPLQPADWQAFLATAHEAAEGAGLVTISGSMPPGIEPTEIVALVEAVARSGCPVIVDSSGAALRAILGTTPYGVKVNGSELSAALDMPVNSIEQAAAALAELHRRGIQVPIVSLGAQGAMAASEAGICHVLPPTLKIISTIGSGDSLLAGLASGLLRGETLMEALHLGVACGAADALTIGGGLIDMADVERIREQTVVHWL